MTKLMAMLVAASLVVVLAACSPPGSNTGSEDQGFGDGGSSQDAQQVLEEQTGGMTGGQAMAVCDVPRWPSHSPTSSRSA